jgi:hypothetical protein
MSLRLFFIIPGFLIVLNGFGQDSLKKTNPIIYGDAGTSVPLSGVNGIQIDFNVNYQVNKSLFTARFAGVYDFNFYIFPPANHQVGVESKGSLTEWGILYGRRFINRNHSFSFSAGVSLNDKVSFLTDVNQQRQRIESHYPGLAFEANVLWFKSTKKRYRIYGIIPVGNPTGFGNDIGFKLGGNISQHSYLSLGIVMGIGYHKQY